jgi:3-hydroxyisobutyrate dehydrogenase-like beta-hydroxyacid dehydrogenase
MRSTISSGSISPRPARNIFLKSTSRGLSSCGVTTNVIQRLCKPEVAAAGQLFVIAAGKSAAVDMAAPLLDAIGQRTFVVSETPKSANLVKLGGNFLGVAG